MSQIDRVSANTKREMQLPDVRRAVEIVHYSNPQSIEEFGSSFSGTLSDLSSKLIASDTSAKALGEIGNDVVVVLNLIEENDPSELTKKPSFLGRLFGTAKNNVTVYMNKHKSAKEILNQICSKLEENRQILIRENADLEDTYIKNINTLKLMEELISYGKEKYTALESNLVNEKQLAVENSAVALAIKGSESTLNRFGQKLVRLESAKALVVAQLPQIKIMQEINNSEIDTLRDIIDIAIPMWESQIGLLLSSLKTEKIMTGREQTEKLINSTIKKNSELLATNLDRAIQGSSSTIVTLETIKSVHSNTINSIKKTKEITQISSQNRLTAFTELARLDKEMKAQLIGG